jgi:hypothetical protein
MKLLLVLALSVMVLQAEPPEFPQGHVCKKPSDVRPNNPRDHPCDCRAMDNCDKPEEGQGTGPSENPKCLQFCHKDHCACKSDCH